MSELHSDDRRLGDGVDLLGDLDRPRHGIEHVARASCTDRVKRYGMGGDPPVRRPAAPARCQSNTVRVTAAPHPVGSPRSGTVGRRTRTPEGGVTGGMPGAARCRGTEVWRSPSRSGAHLTSVGQERDGRARSTSRPAPGCARRRCRAGWVEVVEVHDIGERPPAHGSVAARGASRRRRGRRAASRRGRRPPRGALLAAVGRPAREAGAEALGPGGQQEVLHRRVDRAAEQQLRRGRVA